MNTKILIVLSATFLVTLVSAKPFTKTESDIKYDPLILQKMRQLNPKASGSQDRPLEKLCNGQTLFCKSLGLKVLEWDGTQFDPSKLRLLKNEAVTEIIQTTRLGITKGHSCNENLEYRFIDSAFVSKCTKNPLTMRSNKPTVTVIQNYKPITS